MENAGGKPIVLISNHVFHYRHKVYNYFDGAFGAEGYRLHVISNSFQPVDSPAKYVKTELPFSAAAYIKRIQAICPACVIVFLHLKDRIMLPVIWYCRARAIPVIYWNHGISHKTPNSRLKNAVFHYIHNQCDALITYTEDMRRHFSKKNQGKLFVANNTIDLSDIDRNALPPKEAIKAKYGIQEKRVILFVARMSPYKRAELLAESFAGLPDIAVVLVGPGITEALRQTVDAHGNLYYLGEKYGADVQEIFSMSDVFSTPGHIGLAMNEALFWGLPVILLKGNHAPEIFYMKNGVTGYLTENEAEYRQCCISLLRDDRRLEQLSKNCLDTFAREVSIDRMARGFTDAIAFCMNRKGQPR